jgi:hypothetical protein
MNPRRFPLLLNRTKRSLQFLHLSDLFLGLPLGMLSDSVINPPPVP